MKFFKKLFALLTMLVAIPTMSSCGLFVDEDEALEIQSIEALPDLDEDGNVVIVITFKSEDQDPITIKIPKGSDGEQGVGIASIKSEENSETHVVTTTITLTNGQTSSIELQPGASIVDYRLEDEYEDDGEGGQVKTGNILVYFIDSYGNEYGPIPVQKGDSGKDGAGVYHIAKTDNEDGSITLTFIMTDDRDPYVVTIPAPKKGETGRGIVAIVSGVDPETGKYYLEITFDSEDENGNTTSRVDLPALPEWSTVSSKPSDDVGKNGDYAFDTFHGIIYQKTGGTWVSIVIFSTDETTYTVSFDLNDEGSVDHAMMPTGYDTSYQIKKGQYFRAATSKDVPIPTRYNSATSSQYKFVGWCTSKTPGPTNGYFTDLTPVFTDMVLYAIWEA